MSSSFPASPLSRTRLRRLHTLGIFTYEPAFDLQGLILNSASTASSQLVGDTIHCKLDNTGYSYVNRCFGVGALVGLGDYTLAPRKLSYSYQRSRSSGNDNLPI
jgi:hypothetical protein